MREHKEPACGGIPESLTVRPQWVVSRDGVPYDPDRPWRKARVNEPESWGTYEQTVETCEKHGFDGIAFVFTEDDPYVGIDLDACRDPVSGVLAKWASSIVARLASYTEISPSGTGLHIILRGMLPGEKQRPVRKLRRIERFGPKTPEIMACRSGGALTLTGNCLPGHTRIRTRSKALNRFYKRWLAKRTPSATAPPSPSSARIDEDLLERLLENCRNSDDRSSPDFRLCCTAVRLGWAKEEVWARVSSESKFAERGRDYFELTWNNALEVAANGLANAERAGRQTHPFPLTDILERMSVLTDGWPRRVLNELFVHDHDHGITWLKRSAALFGWLQAKVGSVNWYGCSGCITKDEFFHELQRTVQKYEGVQDVPHQPPIEGYYYACPPYERGDGVALLELVGRFTPQTAMDGDLIRGAFMTPMWGGPPGARPIFVITASGRGHGKTTLAEFIGLLYGGTLAFRKNEDASVIIQRLLSQEGLTKRIVLLDNLKSRNFSWAEFESLITTPSISGKKMYVGEASRPNHITYFITVNAATFSTDIAQRSVIIQLSEPSRSGTWYSETRRFIDENRGVLISDMIGSLRRPRKTLQTFSRWADWDREVLSRLPNPNKLQELISQRRTESDVDQQTAALVEEHIRRKLRLRDIDPDVLRIRIPSDRVVAWYNEATNVNEPVSKVSATLRQMAEEGQLKRLRKDPSHRVRRSFLWTGERYDNSPTVDFEALKSRKGLR